MVFRCWLPIIVGTVLVASACATHPGMSGPGDTRDFDQAAISQIENLRSMTIWRVTAAEVRRHPRQGMIAFARQNNLPWAFSIDGDSRFDSTHLEVLGDASPRVAEAALVHLVEVSTGRQISATWTHVDPDTWRAATTYED